MKITKKQRSAALEACERLQIKEVFINIKGEMFTNENAASNSVKNKKVNYARIEASAVETAEDDANDLIVRIEGESDIDTLRDMLTDEQEGGQRAAVIKACELRIDELEKTE